jgi:hypothetical protein
MADGSILHLDVPGFDVGGLWLARIQIQRGRIDGRRPDAASLQDFDIAPRGNADGVMEHVLHASVVQRVTHQGGELLVAASRREGVQGMAVWRGRWHEVSTFLLPGESAADAIRMFDGLVFTDHGDGLEIRGVAAAGTAVHLSDVWITVPGVGEVDIRPASKALAAVPRWAGATTQAGEVWRLDNTLEDDTETHFGLRLATATAVVDVEPDDARDSRQRSALRFIESVREAAWREPERIGA